MSAVISFEELSKKYPTHNVPPYGACIVVPGDKFDPDWEAILEDCSCHHTDFEGKPVTLVQRKAGKDKGERVVYSPPPAASAEGEKETLIPGARSPSQKWKPEEDKVLVKLWNERVLIEKMTPSFPGRTEAAIRLRIQRLEKYGKIKKRTGRKKLRSGFKKRFPQKIIDFAVSLSRSEDPAYSTRDIAKKILEKFGIKISNVAVQKWIVEAASPEGEKIPPQTIMPSERTTPTEDSEETRTNRRWDSKEDDLLLQHMSEITTGSIGDKIEKVAKELNRTETAISLRYLNLKEKKKAQKETEGKTDNLLRDTQEPETPKETLEIEEVERLLFVRGIGYCVRLSENLCQKLGLKEKDFLIVQLEKGKSIRLIPADIQPREISANLKKEEV